MQLKTAPPTTIAQWFKKAHHLIMPPPSSVNNNRISFTHLQTTWNVYWIYPLEPPSLRLVWLWWKELKEGKMGRNYHIMLFAPCPPHFFYVYYPYHFIIWSLSPSNSTFPTKDNPSFHSTTHLGICIFFWEGASQLLSSGSLKVN